MEPGWNSSLSNEYVYRNNLNVHNHDTIMSFDEDSFKARLNIIYSEGVKEKEIELMTSEEKRRYFSMLARKIIEDPNATPRSFSVASQYIATIDGKKETPEEEKQIDVLGNDMLESLSPSSTFRPSTLQPQSYEPPGPGHFEIDLETNTSGMTRTSLLGVPTVAQPVAPTVSSELLNRYI